MPNLSAACRVENVGISLPMVTIFIGMSRKISNRRHYCRASPLLRVEIGVPISAMTAIPRDVGVPGKPAFGLLGWDVGDYLGSNLNSCFLALFTASSENASVNVLLLYQASHWSM